MNGKIPRIGAIDQEIINHCDLCYQWFKDVPYFLLDKLRIRDSRDEPHFTAKIELLSCQIQTNTLFNNRDEKKEEDVI